MQQKKWNMWVLISMPREAMVYWPVNRADRERHGPSELRGPFPSEDDFTTVQDILSLHLDRMSRAGAETEENTTAPTKEAQTKLKSALADYRVS